MSLDEGDLPKTRNLANGMGQAVAKRTVFREEDRNSWARVASRVAVGNISLVEDQFIEKDEYIKLKSSIASGAFLTSGRHLQHGDRLQKTKSLELFSNCSTAPTSFLLFYLLLNGSGVGRSYDDSLMVVDWANAPELQIVLSDTHKDYPKTHEEAKDYLSTFRGEHWTTKNAPEIMVASLLNRVTPPSLKETVIYKVEDSREGWAKSLELFETMAYNKERDKLLVLDLSEVRPLGSPIGGMQNRPASGPLSLARAYFNIVEKVISPAKKGSITPWLQTMKVDHYISEEVQVGGARRAARMSTKDWKDPEIIDFIECKSKGGLWTSNNSIMVDAEFWAGAKIHGTRANNIFMAATENSFINGEPGFINGDRLEDAITGFDRKKPIINSLESKRYQVKFGLPLLKTLSSLVSKTRFATTTNPCVTGDTLVLTDQGWGEVNELKGSPFIAIVNGYDYTASGFWWTGKRQIFELRADNGSVIKATFDHEFHTRDGWCPLSLLKPGSELTLPNNKTAEIKYAKVISITSAGEADVFDCSIPGINAFNGNGLLVHNCGEIPLHVTGGYCVISDFAPILACPVSYNYFIKNRHKDAEVIKLWDSRVEESIKLGVRFLIRANQMDSLYSDEVKRTQRIGLGPTGLHEWAWLRYGFTFSDLIDEERSKNFWAHLRRLSNLAKDEADKYCNKLGINSCITVTTAKPSGSVSKIFGLTEGVHLPARRKYIRWVQFRGYKLANGSWEPTADPLLAEYEAAGYPIKELKTFPGMSIVGFPTIPTIMKLGMGEEVVTAKEASPEDQYKWLKLLEKYWLGESRGNNLSYTLKVDVSKYSLDDYRKILLENQPQIRCCSVLPIKPDSQLGYEYLPEEEVSEEEYQSCIKGISGHIEEGIDIEALTCESGVCPL